MADLDDFRSEVRALLASAVDATTWTDALLDAALRRGLQSYDARCIYEGDFTVTVAGHTQDLSGMAADLNEVLAVAYPWHAHGDFDRAAVRWRRVADHTVILPGFAPQIGELVRVRYTRRHTVVGLDAAVATTVPLHHRFLVCMAAAWWACELRRRQISENPATPQDASATLAATAAALRTEFFQTLTLLQNGTQPVWSTLGLG